MLGSWCCDRADKQTREQCDVQTMENDLVRVEKEKKGKRETMKRKNEKFVSIWKSLYNTDNIFIHIFFFFSSTLFFLKHKLSDIFSCLSFCHCPSCIFYDHTHTYSFADITLSASLTMRCSPSLLPQTPGFLPFLLCSLVLFRLLWL